MVRVRECWNVLECNGGSARFSPLAAEKASGAGQPSLAASPESDPHSPLARLPCLRGEDVCTAGYETASSTVKLFSQSKWIHDIYEIVTLFPPRSTVHV